MPGGKILLFVLSCILTSPHFSNGYDSHVQWASKVIFYTSQLGSKGYSAQQVLGKPNKCPDAGDSPCAWAAAHDGPEGGGEEHLKVGYSKPMHIRQVAIAENFNPGAVQIVYAFDVEGTRHVVYRGDPHSAGVASRVMNVIFPITDYEVNAVEIILQCGLVDGWNEIDAIGISESADSVVAEINIAPNMDPNPARENLGSAVNSPYDEVLPVISPDGKTLFIDRKNHPDNIGAHDNIWYSELQPDSTWSTALNIGPPLNAGGSSFVASITPDGNTLLGGTDRVQDTGQFFIWVSHKQEEGWGAPEPVHIRDFYDRSRYIEFCLTNDEKAIVLALDRDDGYGLKDIYVSFANPNGTWTTPKNLGPVVNSAADEATPFMAADGVTLYYASEGFSGFGGMDMYFTRRLDSTWEHWSEPQNLGPGLNTPGWDGYYTIPASGDYAYFVSSENSLGEDDIFRVKLPESLRPKPVVLISGRVLDAKTQKPVRASIHYEILPSGQEVGSASSSPKKGDFEIVLPAGKSYGFRAEAPGYASVSQNLDLTKVYTYKELQQDLLLVPLEVGQTVRMNNIVFDFGKATLQPQSFAELDRVVELLKQNPKMIIAVNGHTDSIGTPEANKELSTERATTVALYIESKGIQTTRLRVQGFGDTKPLVTNSTEDGRKQNRRVEFTILQ